MPKSLKKPSPEAARLLREFESAVVEARTPSGWGDGREELRLARARHAIEQYMARTGELARQAVAYRKSRKVLP